MDSSDQNRMMATTTMSFEGYRIREYLGVVRGVVVRTPTISQGWRSALQSFGGGEISSYTEMCDQARQQATFRMMQHAKELGANGVVGIGYDAAEIGQVATEVLCFGTAVRLEEIRQPA
jgi:uncharacterized protein YbjQ (UPF0145 family)